MNNIPPHWSDGIVEDWGSRWAGAVRVLRSVHYNCLYFYKYDYLDIFHQCVQGITTDSRVSEAAPPRTVHGIKVDDMEKYYRNLSSTESIDTNAEL